MNTEQTKKILTRIKTIETDLDQLRDVRTRLASSEYVSATLASGGGSRSYTRADLSKISQVITELVNELKSLRKILAGGTGGQPSYITTVYL